MPPLITFSGCQPCSLRKQWQWLYHPQIPTAAPKIQKDYRVFCVGEAPGDTEDREGVPFVGMTGKYLRNLLPDEWKQSLYWSNTVRCHPPKNRKPTVEEITCCSVYQERDLCSVNPHAILAIGDYALKYFWNDAWIMGMRGIPFPVELQNGHTTWCYGIFHPRYVMESEKRDQSNPALPVYKNDLKNFFDRIPYFAANPPTVYKPPVDKILYPKNRLEAINLYERLKRPFAHDIETHRLKPYMRDARIATASFSDGDLTFAFPVDWPGLIAPWGKDTYKELMLRGDPWIAQHAAMEYLWIWYLTGSPHHNFEDVEVMARLRFKRAGCGSLDKITRIHLGFDIKKYSNVDRNRILDYPVEKVLEYNALDSWSTYLSWDKFVDQLTEVDVQNYIRLIDATKSTVGMEIQGLHIDIPESERLQKDIYGKLREYENASRQFKEVRQFEETEQRNFQISAPETVGHVIVSYCGLQLPKTNDDEGKKWQWSTSEDDLQPLLGKHPLVEVVLDYREVSKLLTTYLDPILSGRVLGVDGLLHPSYTTLHTRTYRLSSEDPNIQNFPKRKNKHIRRQLIAPPGHIFAAFDYGQLEARVIQMFSGDKALKYYMIEQSKAVAAGDKKLERKYDIHYKWLDRIIELYPQYMDRLARNSGEKEEGKILKAGRTIIKTDFVFATFYGSQIGSLTARTEVPQNIMTQVWHEFWDEYKEAKVWVDSMFRGYQMEGEVRSITGRARNEVLPGNEVINSPVQGTAAEIVIEAQNALAQRAVHEDMYLHPRINIHDDLIFVLPDTSNLEGYIRIIADEIVKPRFPFITVPLLTECRVGYNWCDLDSVAFFFGSYHE